MSKVTENRVGRVVHLNLGVGATADVDWHRGMLSLHCVSGEVTLRMRLEPGMLGDYAGRSGSLAIATWMVVEVRCTPEDAMELATAIGPRVMSNFVFTN